MNKLRRGNTLRVIKKALDLGYTLDKEGIFRNPKGNIVDGCKDSADYIKVGLRILEFKSYPLRTYKVQAYLKYGESAFVEGIEIRHLNSDREDASWDNIAIGTHQENMMDMPKEKRIMNASNPIHNHTAILADREKGMTYGELMKKYNISSKGTMSYIIRNSLEAQTEVYPTVSGEVADSNSV